MKSVFGEHPDYSTCGTLNLVRFRFVNALVVVSHGGTWKRVLRERLTLVAAALTGSDLMVMIIPRWPSLKIEQPGAGSLYVASPNIWCR
jgi:hypothetical protein